MLHISINIVPHADIQYQCEQIINYFGLEVVMNDYNSVISRGPVQTNAAHDLFNAPFVKPHFVVINCVSNSSYNPTYQLMLTEDAGIGDFSENGPAVARWRTGIDAVQAPHPEITVPGIGNGGAFRFLFSGQRGRTNQVLGSSNLTSWTVLTNVHGTNAPILFRDGSILTDPRRFYRIRRL